MNLAKFIVDIVKCSFRGLPFIDTGNVFSILKHGDGLAAKIRRQHASQNFMDTVLEIYLANEDTVNHL